MAGYKTWADPFYLSKDWRRLRYQVLVRDGYRCVICGIDVSGKGQARIDHRLPRKTHPELELGLSNLRTLCIIHDAQSHREKGSGSPSRDSRFSGALPSGEPIDPGHPWNK